MHVQFDVDFVVVCTGLYASPHLPTYDGIEDFRGKVGNSLDDFVGS